MDCPQCSTTNESWAKYCKSCGAALSDSDAALFAVEGPSYKRDVYLLLGYLGLEVLISVFYIFFNRFVLPGMSSSGSGSIASYYQTLQWITFGLTFIYVVIMIVLCRNLTARIFLGIYLLIKIIIMVSYFFTY